MFFKQYDDWTKTILIVYVDDIILTRDNMVEMEKLKNGLATKFEVKNLGQIPHFLGMKVARSKTDISVSQRKYVLDLVSEIGMFGCKPSDTPIEVGKKIENVGNSLDIHRYHQLGKLIYLSHTRPDITITVSMVS